jgi:cell division protein DivIC
MSKQRRPEPKRRAPASRPGRAAPRKWSTKRRESNGSRSLPDPVEPIKRALAVSAERRSEQRFGLTARRAVILAAVVCVLTLTVAGPVRTYFAQRTEMSQLAASEAALRSQIADLEQQKVKLADPAYIAAQARERLGFVMPGDIPYQVQLPAGSAVPEQPGPQAEAAASSDPWYTSLWHTIADAPHSPPAAAVPAPPEPALPASVAPGG